MMRFVDLGKQLSLDPDEPNEPRLFAFFNTVPDQFLTLGIDQVWESWDHFARSFKISARAKSEDINRYRSLCPPWVFEAEQQISTS